jgi:hypothetical protein
VLFVSLVIFVVSDFLLPSLPFWFRTPSICSFGPHLDFVARLQGFHFAVSHFHLGLHLTGQTRPHAQSVFSWPQVHDLIFSSLSPATRERACRQDRGTGVSYLLQFLLPGSHLQSLRPAASLRVRLMFQAFPATSFTCRRLSSRLRFLSSHGAFSGQFVFPLATRVGA